MGTTNSTVATYSDDYYNEAEGCTSSCACRTVSTGSNKNTDPVYHTAAVPLADFGKSCADKDFNISITNTSAGSISGIVSGNNNVSDIGGISNCDGSDDPCGCCTDCASSSNSYCSYSGNKDAACQHACLSICGTGLSTSALLDLKILDFDATILENQSLLQWTINPLAYADIQQFEIERSTDGIHFEKIGTISAYSSLSYDAYSFIDEQPLVDYNYYRITQTNIDGNLYYSPTQVIHHPRGQALTSLNIVNINNETIKILDQHYLFQEEDLDMQIINPVGQTYPINGDILNRDIDISFLPTGIYFVSLLVDNKYKKIYKIQKT